MDTIDWKDKIKRRYEMSSSFTTTSAEQKLARKDLKAKITNSTSEIIIVYGSRRETEGGNYDNSWYVLHPGKTIPDNWECDGFFVPNDRTFRQENGETVNGPVAVKYGSSATVSITQNGNQYVANGTHNEGVFRPSEIDWSVPNFSAEYCQNISLPKYQIPENN